MEHAEGQRHPIGIYLKIWGLLFVLSAASYAVDWFDVEGYLRWFLILLFMVLKAGLIVSVFMHMLWETWQMWRYSMTTVDWVGFESITLMTRVPVISPFVRQPMSMVTFEPPGEPSTHAA